MLSGNENRSEQCFEQNEIICRFVRLWLEQNASVLKWRYFPWAFCGIDFLTTGVTDEQINLFFVFLVVVGFKAWLLWWIFVNKLIRRLESSIVPSLSQYFRLFRCCFRRISHPIFSYFFSFYYLIPLLNNNTILINAI